MRAFALAALLVTGVVASAQDQSPGSLPGETRQQYDARMKWFTDAKFGIFICWGPVSLVAQEIGWSRNGPRPGLVPDHADGGVPLEVYDNLYQRFNPTLFNAREWAATIKQSGARYVIFLVKHHDGFCLFDTRLTDYQIMGTPLHRDVTGELAQALHEAGIRIFWYYSPPDWHHPDYRTANHARYIDYLHGEIRELCTNYGRIDGLWFDGLGGTAEDWDAPRLFSMLHQLQPGIIINNRAGLVGDFDTPEQQIGRFQISRPWESCMTMSTAWAWAGADAPVQSLKECLHLLIRCAGGGGNLALDTGPMPDGRLDPRAVANYRGMGEWLRKYGQSIYATTGGPYAAGLWGVATRQGTRVYLHILRWDDETLRLPPLPMKVLACSALTGGSPTVRQTADVLEVTLPAAGRSDIDTIIELKLNDRAAYLKPILAWAQGSLTLGRPATASSNWSDQYHAETAFDGDEGTRWGAAPGSTSGWLQVDLGEPKTFGRILVLEAPWNRVRKFQLQVRDGEAWKTFHEGTTLGDFSLKFPPVTARHFRLNILDATDVPTIWEVHLYPPTQ